VAPAAEGVARGAEQEQDGADDEHDNAEGPQDWDVRYESNDEQNNAENDHVTRLL
jgi:hypothetical protein